MIARNVVRPLAAALAALAVSLVFLASSAPSQEEARTGEAILKEIDALKPPAYHPQKSDDRAYVESYVAEARKVAERRSELVKELLEVDPGNARLPKLLVARWQGMFNDLDALDKEIAEAVEKTGDADLRIEGAYVKARLLAMTARDPQTLVKAVEAFADVAPKGDKRAGGLLFAVSQKVEDPAVKTALEDRIVKDYPDVADRVKGARRLRDAVGKPFELEFKEAVSGATIRMADLKGKVVVVDFWATWCGPCVAEMPKMKKLYAEFKEKGVEFVGISLDEPEEEGKGLTKLKEFVAKNEIGWPQYYQGKGWEGDFSRGWGINSIPRVFAVDADGNLFSTEARGKLETMIPELLAKAAASKSGG